MDKFEINRLRDLPIEDVAQRLGLDVKRHLTTCFVHHDHKPSMHFNVKKNTAHCYSCGAHFSGSIDLTMHVLNKSFLEACEWLANAHNVILTSELQNTRASEGDDKPQVIQKSFDVQRYERYFEHPWLSQEAQHFLYDVRHLHPAVVRFCRLNSYGDWLQIPYYDQQGRLQGIQRRYMGHDPEQPRFRLPYGQACHLYNQQVIPMLKEGEPIYIGEGPSDVWALLSSGRKAVGVVSATTLRKDDLRALAGREVRLFPDQDAAGESLYQKLVSAAVEIGFCVVREQLPQGVKDFAEYWVQMCESCGQ